MGASELMGWRKFWAREPWGPYRDNIHAGLLASIIVNALRGKGKQAVTFQDFMLVDRDEHRKRKSSEFLNWLKAVATRKPKGAKTGAT